MKVSLVNINLFSYYVEFNRELVICLLKPVKKSAWMKICLPKNHHKQDMLAMLGRILQKCPQIVSGNGRCQLYEV